MNALPNDPPWLKAAFKDLGVHEIKGAKHDARVLEMYKVAGHPEIKNDETAWCSAAMNTWMIEQGLPATKSLMARSWLNYGKAVSMTNIPRGAILIFPRNGSPTQGHVCLCLEDHGTTLLVIGGNQSDAGAVTVSTRK